MLAAAAALTVTETLLVWVPLLTVTVAASALYRVMTPLLAPDTVATPLVRAAAADAALVIVVVSAVPPFAAVVLFVVMVGCVSAGAVAAPPNVRFLLPA